MDIFATGKAIDLYATEMKRRIEELEEVIKDKETTIKKHKERVVICEAMFLAGVSSLIVAVSLAVNHVWCT